MGFKGFKSVGEFFLHRVSNFIAAIATTNNANRDVIILMSIAVEVYHHWKQEIMMKQSANLLFVFAAVQLITSLAGDIIKKKTPLVPHKN